MLIHCPECNKEISDKAISCINCGFPLQMVNDANNAPKVPRKANLRTKRAYNGKMKLPNGYGTIRFLSGKRRKPFAVCEPVKGYKDNGTPVAPKYLGYFGTYNEAYQFLVDYHRQGLTGRLDLTFKDVYELWYQDKFENGLRELSDSAKKNCKWAFNQCKEIYDIPIAHIGHKHLQAIMDAHADKSESSIQNLFTLFNGVCMYSVKNNLMMNNVAQYVECRSCKKTEEGEPFTEEEIKKLWDHKDDRYVQIILIYIYTGFRLSELKVANIDLEGLKFEGGLKTTSGKERKVPIHSSIVEFVKMFDQKHFSPNQFGEKTFRKTLVECGISEITENGKVRTPHDCRHTFNWLCDTFGVEEISKKLMSGHSLGKDVSRSTYSHRTIEQLRAEIEKVKVPILDNPRQS